MEETEIGPVDPALLTDRPPMPTTEHFAETGDLDGSSVGHTPFELDENTMRSLQQFIDSHNGFQTSPNHSADEQVSSPFIPSSLTYCSLPSWQQLPLIPIQHPHSRIWLDTFSPPEYKSKPKPKKNVQLEEIESSSRTDNAKNDGANKIEIGVGHPHPPHPLQN